MYVSFSSSSAFLVSYSDASSLVPGYDKINRNGHVLYLHYWSHVEVGRHQRTYFAWQLLSSLTASLSLLLVTKMNEGQTMTLEYKP